MIDSELYYDSVDLLAEVTAARSRGGGAADVVAAWMKRHGIEAESDGRSAWSVAGNRDATRPTLALIARLDGDIDRYGPSTAALSAVFRGLREVNNLVFLATTAAGIDDAFKRLPAIDMAVVGTPTGMNPAARGVGDDCPILARAVILGRETVAVPDGALAVPEALPAVYVGPGTEVAEPTADDLREAMDLLYYMLK